jgi:PAS domain S-box-containing protein
LLKNLSERVRLCYERAVEAREQAEKLTDPEAKADFLAMERRWLLLARSYGFGESLDDFLHAPVPHGRPFESKRRNEAGIVLANTPFLLSHCSSDLRYLFVSEAYAKMIGRRPEEIVGKKIIEVMGDAGFNTILPHVRAVLSGHRVEYETDVHFKDAGPRLLHVIYTPDADELGNVNGWVASIMDITEKRQAEEQAEEHIAADLRNMMLLNQLSNRLVRESSEHAQNMKAVIDTAIAITRADKGNLQLFDAITGVLTIAAQRGFDAPFLNFFAAVRNDGSACAAAMKSGERAVVEDVRASEIFAGQPSREVMLDAGVCAVISTPLLASTGNLLGMISTHFAKPHRPDERELHLIDLLARQTADYLERKKADEIKAILVREIQHRGNNLLAVIQTIATRSLSGTQTLAEAREAFEARLQALARANHQLTKSHWSGVDLSELVRLELQPYAGRTMINGVDVMLSPQYGQNLSLVLHELATNGAKYGALSNGTGKINVSWTITRQDKQNKLKFKWQESGGPPVAVPTRQGFGTVLIKAVFPNARIGYEVEGLSCEIDVPLGQGDYQQMQGP